MKILLIDDEEDVRDSLRNFIVKLGHKVITAKDGDQGLKNFNTQIFDLVITDLRMPGMDGLELLNQIKRVQGSPIDVVVITGHGDMDNAICALKYGAYDYLKKPIDVRELAITIERSAQYTMLRKKYRELKKDFDQRVELEVIPVRLENEHLKTAYLEEIGLNGLSVYSDAMRQVLNEAERYSTDRQIPVLIEGESGTGKELVAQYIHHFGKNEKFAPFIAINCGAISQHLFEGELFGHETGAFTGATRKGRMGKIEMANGGTIFLDEIGEMPLELQVKLLRVLETKRLYRIGGDREIQLDIRIIAATNKNLKQEVQKKRFRLDLLYRINVGNIYIPPLRERKEDIVPLAHRFINRAYSRRGQTFSHFSATAEDFLLRFGWPGNVRHLKNTMDRLSILHSNHVIDQSDLNFIEEREESAEPNMKKHPVIGQDPFDLPFDRLDLEKLNQQIIQKVMDKHQGNQTQSAQYLGFSRRVLQGRLNKIKKLEDVAPSGRRHENK